MDVHENDNAPWGTVAEGNECEMKRERRSGRVKLWPDDLLREREINWRVGD